MREKPHMTFEESLIGRPNTIKTQVSLYRNWIKPYSNVSDDKLLHHLVRTWQKKDLKPSTMKIALGVAIKYLEFKTGNKPNAKNLVKIIGNMSMPSEVKCWNREEAEKALKFCKEELPEMYLPLLVTLHTGIRKGELCGLKWEDIDWINGRIKIKRSYDGPTKNGKPRTIPISNKLAFLLEKYYNVGDEKKPLFEGGDLNYHLHKICRLAGVKKISWHQIRHTFSSLALESGVSPRLVAELLGHSSVSITLSMYWSLIDDKIDLGFLP